MYNVFTVLIVLLIASLLLGVAAPTQPADAQAQGWGEAGKWLWRGIKWIGAVIAAKEIEDAWDGDDGCYDSCSCWLCVRCFYFGDE